jgi:hypothetical protein
MATTEYTYRINGTLNTSDGVLANMEKLANSAASWISFDMFTGKWDVVINKAESVSAAFDDSNIIGSIQLNILGLKDMYNSVEVQFPHSDLNGQKDYIRISIPAEDRLPGEPDNNLTINYDLLSDPVQAQFLGLVELKQSRLDKTIVFRADYSKINIPAGAVISVTNTTFGWTAKEFRIVTVKEISDGDALHTEITAIEYDANTYSTDDLYRYIRSNATGIITFGAIGQPDAPQVTKFEGVSRPGILIEADVPGGLVNGMEFWLTRDTTISSDDLRKYDLIGTVYGTGGTNLTQGDTVELNYDTLDTGNLYVKVRGINGDITGPYSVPSGLINYNAKQVTDAIGANTAVNNSAGSSITGLLGTNALLWLLNQLMSGNKDNTSLLGGLSTLFNITGNTANAIVSSTSGTTSVVHASKYNAIVLTKGDEQTITLTSVVLPFTGTYKVRYFINWGGEQDGLTTKILKRSAIIIPGKTPGPWSATGDVDVPKFEDHQIEGFIPGTAGESISLQFRYQTQDGTGSTGATAIWIIAEVMAVPTQYGV